MKLRGCIDGELDLPLELPKIELLQLCTMYIPLLNRELQLEGFVHLGSAPNPAAEVRYVDKQKLMPYTYGYY